MQGGTEEILSKFTELRLTEELELDTEDGGVKAYRVYLTGTAVPLMFSAKLITEQGAFMKIISDNRTDTPSDDNE